MLNLGANFRFRLIECGQPKSVHNFTSSTGLHCNKIVFSCTKILCMPFNLRYAFKDFAFPCNEGLSQVYAAAPIEQKSRSMKLYCRPKDLLLFTCDSLFIRRIYYQLVFDSKLQNVTQFDVFCSPLKF